ncbi:hypothetical protein KFE94_11635 [bacterium SCSIO 12643]|nr:hypothetical protein KFE94_11635 [bacterium SCSIO 12643]
MKKSTISFWIIIIIGTLAVFSSIFMLTQGEPFNNYFWGGFCGIILIGTASIELKKKN